MAEYIDRTQLEPDTEWSEYEDGLISYSQSQINSSPTADVIERSKIDKAIEDIKELYTEWENITDDAKLETNPFGAVLNIIQRNIGE